MMGFSCAMKQNYIIRDTSCQGRRLDQNLSHKLWLAVMSHFLEVILNTVLSHSIFGEKLDLVLQWISLLWGNIQVKHLTPLLGSTPIARVGHFMRGVMEKYSPARMELRGKPPPPKCMCAYVSVLWMQTYNIGPFGNVQFIQSIWTFWLVVLSNPLFVLQLQHWFFFLYNMLLVCRQSIEGPWRESWLWAVPYHLRGYPNSSSSSKTCNRQKRIHTHGS